MALNTGALAGLTVFITGASRGIGKAIALKCARDGANIVVAAKTADPHPTLPGTIYTAAEDIEKVGGKCLPCVVDVRSEEQVEAAVKNAVDKFGGIDILVNNASAIFLSGTADTSMKRYDLMNQVNARGTYLCSQKCLPHLEKSKHPHILNLSPPLVMSPHWFQNHVAYSIAKYGMSMCVLGMSAEFKSKGIVVNALWPRTGIYTAAIEMLLGDESAKKCRKPEILSDAAYIILSQKGTEATGNFYIDDEVLTNHGITDLDQYSCVPGSSLMPDFFLEARHLDSPYLDKEASIVKGDEDTKKSGPQVVFDGIRPLLNEHIVQDVGATFLFLIQGQESSSWYLNLKTGEGSVEPSTPDKEADVTMRMKEDDFVSMFTGKMNPTTAFMGGKLKIAGNMMLALKLEKLMKLQRSKL